MNRSPLAESDVKKAYEKIHAGKATYAQAAAAVGITANQLRWQVVRLGLSQGNKRTYKSTDGREARLKAAHTAIVNGQSYEMAARDFGVSKTQLWKLLRQYGYYDGGTIRQQKHKKGNMRQKFTVERARRIYELYYGRGYPLKTACAECDLSLSGYYEWRKACLLGKWEVRRNRTDDDYRRMYAQYLRDERLTPAGIAKQYGVSYTYLLKKWSLLGLNVQWERRNEEIGRKLGTDLTSVELNDLWRQYSGGTVNSRDIALKGHVEWRKLKQLWRDEGYPVDEIVNARSKRKEE